ncbi:hypothetical protein [Streptomyces abyssalis]|nr:hypothetical protein [Streptomyces abyssalis]
MTAVPRETPHLAVEDLFGPPATWADSRTRSSRGTQRGTCNPYTRTTTW